MISKVNSVPPLPENITYSRLKRHEIYVRLRDVKEVMVIGKLAILYDDEGDISH